MTQTISTIVDGQIRCALYAVVYMTQTISTIVDHPYTLAKCTASLYDPNNFYYCRLTVTASWPTGSLYDPNNFYYCRCIENVCKQEVVYMTQTISTIVDILAIVPQNSCLYDPNNFYYCRQKSMPSAPTWRLYDPNNFYYCRLRQLYLQEVFSLYDPNNFYYCRQDIPERARFGVYMTQTISTIVDPIPFPRRYFYVYMTQTISTIVDTEGIKPATPPSI